MALRESVIGDSAGGVCKLESSEEMAPWGSCSACRFHNLSFSWKGTVEELAPDST